MHSSLSTSRVVAWTVWVIASIFYAYQYILRVMPNIMLNEIMEQFDISAATFGQFSGVYYLGYSLMHLPIGILLDRFGPRRVMSGCMLLTVVGSLPILYAEYWAYPIVGRALIGMGSTAAILGVFKVIRMTFSETRFPRMLSFSVMIGLLGAIYGGGPVSYLCKEWGHQAVVQLFAMIGVALALITYWIVPNVQSAPQGSVFADIKEVMGNKKVIASCLFAGLMLGPLEGFADVWAAVFLQQVYGFESVLAASMPSMLFLGMCFGAPLLSLIGEKVGSYVATIIGAGVVMGLSFALLLAAHLSPAVMTLSFVLVGVCCAYQILAIYKVSTYVREEVAGLTTAVANMIIMLFGYAFHAVIGGIVNAMGGPSSARALSYGIAVIPVALCIGVAGYSLLSLAERKQKNSVKV